MNPYLVNDKKVFWAAGLAAALIFATDLAAPPEIAYSILYPVVLIFVLFASRSFRIFLFTAFLTLLTALDLGFLPAAQLTAEAMANRLLGLVVLWSISAVGVKAKEWLEKKLYLASIVDCSEDAILGKNLEGEIAYWNSGAEKLYGYRSDEMVGQHLNRIIPSNRHPEINYLLQQVKQGKDVDNFETAWQTKKGRLIDISLTISPIKNLAGEIIGASTVARNITDRKWERRKLQIEKAMVEQHAHKTQEELRGVQKELKDAKRLSDIGTLAATVAHELRNPLGVIRTAVFNIKRKQSDDRLSKHIINIERKIMESEQIINNLLNYSRIKMPQHQTVRIDELLSECVQSTRRRHYGRPVPISTQTEWIQGLSIQSDPLQLKEVFENILNNAFEAVPSEGGQIFVKAQRTPEDMLTVSVIDNGEGIAQEDLYHVFKPFFTKKSKGTGLGLAICHEIVTLHNGKIEIASEKGKGTSVTIRLPIERPSR